MRVYLDTSAFVPLLVEEPASEASRMLWNESGSVYATRLLCPLTRPHSLWGSEPLGRDR